MRVQIDECTPSPAAAWLPESRELCEWVRKPCLPVDSPWGSRRAVPLMTTAGAPAGWPLFFRSQHSLPLGAAHHCSVNSKLLPSTGKNGAMKSQFLLPIMPSVKSPSGTHPSTPTPPEWHELLPRFTVFVFQNLPFSYISSYNYSPLNTWIRSGTLGLSR